MSIGLHGINLISGFAYVAVWFGSVGKIETVNQTKSCG